MTLEEKKAELQRILAANEGIHFRHLRTDEDGSICVAYELDGTRIKKAAFVFCSPKEQFCRVDGRWRAANRFLKFRPRMTVADLDVDVKDKGANTKIIQAAGVLFAQAEAERAKAEAKRVAEAGGNEKARAIKSTPNWFPRFAKAYIEDQAKKAAEAEAKRREAEAAQIHDTF